MSIGNEPGECPAGAVMSDEQLMLECRGRLQATVDAVQRTDRSNL